MKGHADVVKCLLKNGADVNAVGGDGGTPLLFASHNGDVAVVKALVGGGANVNTANADNLTAVLMASAGGHKAVVKYLIEQARADISDRVVTTPDGRSVTASLSAFAAAMADADTVKYVQKRVNAVCGECGKNGASKLCGGCLAVYYCDGECQTTDWKQRHKKQCKELKRERTAAKHKMKK